MTERAVPLLVERCDRVLLLTLNRPEARNALNQDLLQQLNAALRNAEEDSAVAVVVITGNGPAFCAGADLKESKANLEGADFWTRYARANQSLEIHRMLPKLSKPVIAAVNGFAVAGGCGLAMSCDLVIASDEAKFGYPEAKRGLVAAMVMVSLSRVVGRRHALDLLLTGRLIGPDEAKSIGMINRIAPADALVEAAISYADEMSANSPSAMRISKHLFQQVSELDHDRALDYARDINQMVRQTRDAQSGVSAFSEKGNKND